MKYMVSIKEINYGSVEVEAASLEEAKEKAEREYYNGNVFWKDTDLEYPTVRNRQDRGEHDER
jgi:hypothetical protein